MCAGVCGVRVCVCVCVRGTCVRGGVCGARRRGEPPRRRAGAGAPGPERTGRGVSVRPHSPPGGVKWFPAAPPARYVRLRGPGAARGAPRRPRAARGSRRTSLPAWAEPGPPQASSRGVRSGRRGAISHFTPRGAACSISPSRCPLAPRTQRSWAAALAARSASPGARRPRGSPGGAVPGSALGSAGPGRTRAAGRGAHALRPEGGAGKRKERSPAAVRASAACARPGRCRVPRGAAGPAGRRARPGAAGTARAGVRAGSRGRRSRGGGACPPLPRCPPCRPCPVQANRGSPQRRGRQRAGSALGAVPAAPAKRCAPSRRFPVPPGKHVKGHRIWRLAVSRSNFPPLATFFYFPPVQLPCAVVLKRGGLAQRLG